MQNIDLRHTLSHLWAMSDSPVPQSDLSIARHAAQTVLHHVLAAESRADYGLLGGRNEVVEVVHPCNQNQPDPDQIERTIRLWTADDITLLAMYASDTGYGGEVYALHGKVVEDIAGTRKDLAKRLRRLPLLLVRMDTAGRLEAALFAAGPDKTVELQLTLQEDGRTIPHVA